MEDKKDLKVYELTDKLMQLYIKYLKENYSLAIFRPVSELYDFLDTLTGRKAFNLCENAITYGDTQDYFSYDGKCELNFYSKGCLIDDINKDKKFIEYLHVNNYFEKE